MVLLLLVVTQAPIELKPGLVITRSTRVVPKVYQLPAHESLDSALIVIRGDDITVDFRGATLRGTRTGADPDRGAGVAVRVEGGRNVRILNAKIRGYKIGILARRTRGLHLSGSDLSGNWKPRLYSLVEHESLVDWLSFHRNDKREWMRFGAAIYLEDVKGAEVRDNVAVGGMNALLLVRTDSSDIRDNNFSFNSGLGIGLYRSSDNRIIHNRLDFNVRGYSHGRYTRGQDSAALLIYEQSCRNLVAYNSLTHSGDGVFLWAGQTTMDSGTGGANDNIFYGNDVSYATANGIEATFSRNAMIANRAWGSEYGIWGGYSFSTLILHNDFRGNRTGIAIEHGQDNVIQSNRFTLDSTAIRLWADSIAPSDWGYPKHRDTRSRDYLISGNVFWGNRVAVRARNTTGLSASDNRWNGVDTLGFFTEGNFTSVDSIIPPHAPFPIIDSITAGVTTFPSSELSLTPRSSIVVDEWGPYDWQSPKLWPLDSTRAVPLRLATLGPAGPWRVVRQRGIASLSLAAGQIGDAVVVTPKPDSLGDWELTLESRGRRFSYGRFEPAIDWSVRIIPDSSPTAPFSAVTRLSRLDFMWYRPPRSMPGFPAERWKLEATGTVTLAPGDYTLRTISDDAIRVWVDGTLVIDDWEPHESRVDDAPLTGGRHDLRVEYYQKDGWVELRVEILRSTSVRLR